MSDNPHNRSCVFGRHVGKVERSMQDSSGHVRWRGVVLHSETWQEVTHSSIGRQRERRIRRRVVGEQGRSRCSNLLSAVDTSSTCLCLSEVLILDRKLVNSPLRRC